MNKKLTLQTGKLKPYLLLLVVLLLAYLPVSTFYFGMKNDAFSDNFPNKFFFSEAISSGFLPLWNPYLNFGFPIYADPGFAFWNPITWFFGAVIKYNAYTLTVEVLLYLYIAGVTMYGLGRHFNFTRSTAFTVAVMYMCSGFFVGELQHINFITAAAFLPLLLQQFLVLFKHPGLRNACLTALAYYMVFAGGHPAIPIATMYFLFTLGVALFVFHIEARRNFKTVICFHIVSLLILTVLFLPAIYSYLNIVGEYARAVPAEEYDRKAMHAQFSFSPYISFLYPFATTKDIGSVATDLTMRNYYFSFIGLALAVTQVKSKDYIIRSLMISAGVMLILSSIGPVKTFLFTYLPLLKYIRTNSEFRILSLLCLCIIAGRGFINLEKKRTQSFLLFRKLMLIIGGLSVCLLTYIMTMKFALFSKNFTNNLLTAPKAILDNFSFPDVLLIAVILNLGLVLTLLAAKGNLKKIRLIIVIDLIVNTIIYLPFSGVGIVTLSQIQQIYDRAPLGIITPPLQSLNDIDTLPEKTAGLVGNWGFYNKQIGITSLQNYPSYFRSTEAYFDSSLPDTVNNLPYVFLKSEINTSTNKYSTKNVTVDFFSPQNIQFGVNLDKKDTLVLLQNFYKFWEVKVDGKISHANRSLVTFLSVPISKGEHSITFTYRDRLLLMCFISSFFALMGILIFVYKTRRISRQSLLPILPS